MVLKLAASRPTSSSPRTGMGVVRSWVSATCSAVLGELLDGSGGAAQQRHADQARDGGAAEGDEDQAVAQHVEDVVRSPTTLRAICTAPPLGSDAVSMR